MELIILSADSQPKSVGLVWGLVATGARLSLHSSNEPGELSQWLCHDDSTINIVIIIINKYMLCLVWQRVVISCVLMCQLLNLFNDWEWTTYFADYGKSQSSFVRVRPSDCIVILEKSVFLLLANKKCNKVLISALTILKAGWPTLSVHWFYGILHLACRQSASNKYEK